MTQIEFDVDQTCTGSHDFSLRVEVGQPIISQLLDKFVLIQAPECSNGNVYKQCEIQNGGQTSRKCNFRCKCSSKPGAICRGSLFMHDLIGSNSIEVTEMSVTVGYT